MIIYGHYNRDRNEGTGRFQCPRCDHDGDFTLVRTWSYFHIYFIPLAKARLVAERILCRGCNNAFPITVLAGTAQKVPSAFEAGTGDAESISDHFGNVVEFTDAAVDEVRRRHAQGQFENDVVVRVDCDRSEQRKVTIAFDFPLADGRDWIGQSHGIPVVVDRRVAPDLQGRTIDFRDGEFIRT